LIDRFGPRPIIVAAAFLAGVGYILLSWVHSYFEFMLVYLGVISLAFIAGFVHSPMVIANSWFIRRRARAMTVVSAAVPVGGALISPLLAIGADSRLALVRFFVGLYFSYRLPAAELSGASLPGKHGACARRRARDRR
jgi:MFS family permease